MQEPAPNELAQDALTASAQEGELRAPQAHEFAPNPYGQGREGRLTRAERVSQTLGLERPEWVGGELGIIPSTKAEERRAPQPPRTALTAKTQGGILAQYASGRPSALPGFALVFMHKRAIFLDEWAVRLLDLDQHLAQTWVDVKHLLRTLGPEIKHKVFFYVKQLRDNQMCRNSVRKLKLPCPYGLNPYNCYKVNGPLKHPFAKDSSGSVRPQCPCPDHANLATQLETAALSVSGPHYSAIFDHELRKARFKMYERPCPKGGYCCRIEQQHQAMEALSIPTVMQTEAVEPSADAITAEGTLSTAALTAEAEELLPSASADLLPATAESERAESELRAAELSAAVRAEALQAAWTAAERAERDDELERREYRVDPHSDRASFYIIFRHGAYAGTKLYVKFNGFFEQGKLSHIMVTLTRVASNLFELVPHMVTDSASFDWIIPTDDCIYGRNYYTMLGYSFKGSELPSKKKEWERIVIHPDDLATVYKSNEVLSSPAHGDNFELLYRSKCHNNSYIWTKYIGKVLGRDPNGRATRVLGINIDINRVLEGYEQLQSRVFTDILTGLRNRIYLITHLDEFIAAATKPLTIIFADITALKVYNDYLGHAVGDKLLCAAALLFQDNIDRNRELIRISGDEFVCLLPNCDAVDASTIINKLITAMVAYNSDAPIRMPVFFSLGAKTVDLSAFAGRKLEPHEKDEAQALFYQALQAADAQMRQNKRLAHQEHYTLVKAYIEQQLKRPITLHDRRLF